MSEMSASSGRIIGISHRVKKTKAGEARPTLVVIMDGDQITKFKLEEETDELDFVFGRFPTEYRKVVEEETDFSAFLDRHLIRQKPKKEELKQAKLALEAQIARITLDQMKGHLSKEAADARRQDLKNLLNCE